MAKEEKKKEEKAWRALTGLNYRNDKGNDVRKEAGDKITDMPENALRHEKAAKNVEPWVAGETENVPDPDDSGDSVVTGVSSRHANKGEDIVLKEVNPDA